jgi:hypothetical protein
MWVGDRRQLTARGGWLAGDVKAWPPRRWGGAPPRHGRSSFTAEGSRRRCPRAYASPRLASRSRPTRAVAQHRRRLAHAAFAAWLTAWDKIDAALARRFTSGLPPTTAICRWPRGARCYAGTRRDPKRLGREAQKTHIRR